MRLRWGLRWCSRIWASRGNERFFFSSKVNEGSSEMKLRVLIFVSSVALSAEIKCVGSPKETWGEIEGGREREGAMLAHRTCRSVKKRKVRPVPAQRFRSDPSCIPQSASAQHISQPTAQSCAVSQHACLHQCVPLLERHSHSECRSISRDTNEMSRLKHSGSFLQLQCFTVNVI